jgi:hypothetical protein
MMGYDPQAKLEEYKVKVTEEVKRSWQRSRLTNKLTDEAQAAHKTGRYEVSLDKFVHLLAIVELDPSTKSPSENRATITSNIGSALHFLGETSLAQDYYEAALAEFDQVKVGWLTWLHVGNINKARMEYIQSRLAMVASGERPDPSSFQDGYGKARQWTKEEMEGTDKSWSIFQPRTWWCVPHPQTPPVHARPCTCAQRHPHARANVGSLRQPVSAHVSHAVLPRTGTAGTYPRGTGRRTCPTARARARRSDRETPPPADAADAANAAESAAWPRPLGTLGAGSVQGHAPCAAAR